MAALRRTRGGIAALSKMERTVVSARRLISVSSSSNASLWSPRACSLDSTTTSPYTLKPFPAMLLFPWNMNSIDSSQHSTLTPVQARIVAAIEQGQTITAAAASVPLHRATIYKWLSMRRDFLLAVRSDPRVSPRSPSAIAKDRSLTLAVQ